MATQKRVWLFRDGDKSMRDLLGGMRRASGRAEEAEHGDLMAAHERRRVEVRTGLHGRSGGLVVVAVHAGKSPGGGPGYAGNCAEKFEARL